MSTYFIDLAICSPDKINFRFEPGHSIFDKIACALEKIRINLRIRAYPHRLIRVFYVSHQKMF